MNQSVMQWALRNNIGIAALQELCMIFNLDADAAEIDPAKVRVQSEAGVQALVRLEASRKGIKLWRNNVGVLKDARGVPVRYGLANDSKALNQSIKSGDLIGWRPIIIASHHVGSRIAQFVSRECKRPGWVFTGREREEAQLRWAQAVNADGGDAGFAAGEGSLH